MNPKNAQKLDDIVSSLDDLQSSARVLWAQNPKEEKLKRVFEILNTACKAAYKELEE